jgi:proline iminopeptidase
MKQKFYVLCCLLGSVAFRSSQMSAEGIRTALQQGPHDAQLSDVRIHYVVRGRGPLVFMSSVGWGLGSLEYQNAFRPLEKQFTMVYVDERGNGDSALPSDLKQMSTSVMADDLNHLREYLGLSKLRLMGHSSGGAIALEYAERHPENLEKAVLIDPVVLGDREEKQTAEYLVLWRDDPKYKLAIENEEKPDNSKTNVEATASLLSFINLYFSDPDRNVPIFLKQLGGSQVSASTDRTHTEADRLAGRQQQKDYGLIQGKILIMNGTVDWICPYQAAVRMHDGIKNSKLELYANEGHFPWIEEPDRFFKEVTEFLNY